MHPNFIYCLGNVDFIQNSFITLIIHFYSNFTGSVSWSGVFRKLARKRRSRNLRAPPERNHSESEEKFPGKMKLGTFALSSMRFRELF